MIFLSWGRALFSLALSLLISLYGFRRKSLDFGGSLSAVLVGSVLTAANGCFCLALLAFFITSSRLTKWKAAEKRKLEQDHKEGGQRNWVQVLCNGGVACVGAGCYVWLTGSCGELPFHVSLSSPLPLHTLAAVACLASISCCCGDTWASEVGSVMGGTPRLITSWRKVPQGTNGGVTPVGLVFSFLGGVVVGVAYFVGLWMLVGFESVEDALSQSVVVIIGGMCGLAGSVVDSILGATVQYSGFSSKLKCVVHKPTGNGVGHIQHIAGLQVLDNNSVNFVSSLITAVVAPVFMFYLCGR